MVSKCMNPRCSARFQYLGRGRLFCVDFAAVEKKSVLPAKKAVTPIRSRERAVEYFWLCAICASTLTIEPDDVGEVRIVPLQRGEAENGKRA